MKLRPLLTAVLLATVAVGTAIPAEADDKPAAAPRPTKETIQKHVQNLRNASKTLKALADQPTPKGLNSSQLASWNAQTALLNALSGRFGSTAGTFENDLRGSGLNGGDMVAKMAQMNLQFLALQEATQMESRRFQTQSNVSKSRHDIAMNAIGNMR